MTKNTLAKDVRILDQSYQISYTEGEEQSLDAAVLFLNEQLSAMKTQNQNSTTARIIAITALNLANQLIEYQHNNKLNEQRLSQRLKAINDMMSKKTRLESPLKEFGANL